MEHRGGSPMGPVGGFPGADGEGDLELGTVTSPQEASMDDFLAAVEDIKQRVDKISRNVDDIEGLHRRALSTHNLEEATRLGRLMDELVLRTNREGQYVRRLLSQLTGDTDSMARQGLLTPSDQRLRRTQQSRWSKRLLGVMNKFQAVQTTYQAKYRQQLERQYLIVKPGATREELQTLTHSAESTSMLHQQIFASANRAQAQSTLAQMRERHQEIQNIERSVQELHQMFLDIALIIEQQGEMIDKIEDHVDATLEYTEQAAEEMKGAVVKQRKMQRRKWILIMIALLIIGIVVAAIVISVATDGKK